MPVAQPAQPSKPPQSTPSMPAQPKVSRIATADSLPGVGLAPGPSSAKRPAPMTSMHETHPSRPARDVADLAPIIGLGVVGLVAILGTGLLMQVAHRPEGWPIARFALGPSSEIALALHGALALLALAIGLTYGWRGVRHWRGDLGGGPPNAIVNAVVAGGALFCAIELISAVY
jgi:hypothetical protein